MRAGAAANPTVRSRVAVYTCLAAYAALVVLTAWHHEPWADEAQAWLLARDATLADLWVRHLHYEGTPGLWHTSLHVVQHLGYPYRGLNLLSALSGCAAAWIVLRFAPLPLWVRMLLPFTFFLAYQYAVVARSYSLLPPLLFASATLLASAPEPRSIASLPGLAGLTAVLALTAAVSAHGFVLSVAISLFGTGLIAPTWRQLDRAAHRRILIAAAMYCCILIAVASVSWPASDVAFPFKVDLRPARILRVATLMFRQAFAGNSAVTAIAIALSLPLLWRGRGLLLFVLEAAGVCAVSGILYWQAWTEGLLFLSWLTAIWVSAARVLPGRAALTGLILVVTCQLYWTSRSVYYDCRSAYSGSREAARFLSENEIDRHEIAGLGYSSVAIQPYFPRNIFVNFDNSFWDWSDRNDTSDPVRFFSSRRPGYVISGYNTPAERQSWGKLLRAAGYDLARHFEGNLFWEDRMTEPEAFDLYQCVRDSDLAAASAIGMGDPVAEKQLLGGFYGAEANAWRWTARRFSVLLKTPGGAEQAGAQLRLRGMIPAVQIQRLGPMTLTATADDRALPGKTFSSPGAFEYMCRIPADVFRSNVIPIGFAFDKAVPPSGGDERELGAIVTSVELSVPSGP